MSGKEAIEALNKLHTIVANKRDNLGEWDLGRVGDAIKEHTELDATLKEINDLVAAINKTHIDLSADICKVLIGKAYPDGFSGGKPKRTTKRKVVKKNK